MKQPFETILEDEAATEQFGADVAMALAAGDLVALKGELGAGKTVLARSAIRQLAGDPQLEVPSPTYTLCQEYALKIPLSHFDLYRLSDPEEVEELGLAEAIANGIALVEWPERAGALLPEGALTIELDHAEGDHRIARISGSEKLLARVVRSLAIREFLQAHWGKGVQRRFLQGDASTRRYETAGLGAETRILMDSPRQPDGPPIRSPNGEEKPYSRIAHLAEDVVPFIAIDGLLRGQGLAAPAIHASSTERGLLLIEHLGSEGMLDAGGAPVPERYVEAARLLARMHASAWPASIDGTDSEGRRFHHDIPRYDEEAMLVEASLFADWYAPVATGTALERESRERFFDIWRGLAALVGGTKPTLVLRDYHSPNLIWRGGKTFQENIGLIDFQDALLGSPAYDVASLGQDARVDVPAALEARIKDAYLEEMSQSENDFDTETFLRDYAIMAAQRATKVLGIFIRLDRRDGKPAYLRHLPRLRTYLARSLAHPALGDYRAWCEAMPELGISGDAS